MEEILMGSFISAPIALYISYKCEPYYICYMSIIAAWGIYYLNTKKLFTKKTRNFLNGMLLYITCSFYNPRLLNID